MISRNKKKKLLILEKELMINSKIEDNTIYLSIDEFNERGLTVDGYSMLKEQITIAGVKDNIKIAVPLNKKEVFQKNIRRMVTYELVEMKQKEKLSYQIAWILLLIGIITIILYNAIPYEHIIYQIFVIISWVFAWSSIEKFFFELPSIRKEEIKLLVLVDSEVIEY